MKSIGRMIALGLGAALVAVACGGGSGADRADPTQPLDQDAPLVGDLPPGSAPNVDQPLFIDGEPRDGVTPSVGSGMLVGAGLTLDQALTTDAVDPIAVRGISCRTSAAPACVKCSPSRIRRSAAEPTLRSATCRGSTSVLCRPTRTSAGQTTM